MSKTISAGVRLRENIVPLDENGDPLEADSKPTSADIMMLVNGSVVATWTASISNWAAGYFVSIEFASALSGGDFVEMRVAMEFATVAVTYREFWTVVSSGSSGSGGGTFNYTVQVSPGINSGATNCDATDRTKYNLEARKSDTKTFVIPVYESDGVTPYDFTGMTLRVVVEPKASATDRQVIENADITVSDNIVSFTTTTANTISGKAETLKWALQRVTTSPAGKEDILFGDYYVREGCAKD